MANHTEIKFTAAEEAMTVSEYSEYLKSGADGHGRAYMDFVPPSISVMNKRPAKQLYKRLKKKTVHPYMMTDTDVFTAVRRFMVDHMVPDELTKSTVDTFERLYNESEVAETAGLVYSWNSNCKKVQYRFNARAIQAFITALVENMPEPVQKIRNELVHGTNVQFEFDAGVQKYMRAAVKFCTPYMERKIAAHERMITGRVFERQLYRTTDMGQAGRLFSDADVSDIMSRTMIMVFCPLYCRSIPITDKNNAFVAVRTATVKRWIGTRTVNVYEGNGGMKRLMHNVKKFREGKISEQEYNEFLSAFKPKAAKLYMKKVKKNGFWIEWTCQQTGQKFRTFTRSANRAERLASMTSFCGESEKTYIAGDTEPAFMEPQSIFSYREEGRFFRTLKHITRNLFRYLFRRTEHDDMLITEHKNSLLGRRSHRLHDFSLAEVMAKSSLLNPVQLDIVATELTLPDELPVTADRRNRRVQMFRNLVAERTGQEPEVTRHEYSELRAATFEAIHRILENDSPELLYSGEADIVGREIAEVNRNTRLIVPSKDVKTYTVEIGRRVERKFKPVIPFDIRKNAKWIMCTEVHAGRFILDEIETDKEIVLQFSQDHIFTE